jgi:hypothetical protein
MNKQEKLQKVEQKISSILDEMGKELSVGQIVNQHTLLKIYMERRQELKNQLEQ